MAGYTLRPGLCPWFAASALTTPVTLLIDTLHWRNLLCIIFYVKYIQSHSVKDVFHFPKKKKKTYNSFRA